MRSEIIGKKFELLAEPAADDSVITIEAHGKRFAVRSFFADVVTDQPLEFSLCGRTLPGASEAGNNIFDRALRDHNFARLIGSMAGDKTEHRKNQCTQ